MERSLTPGADSAPRDLPSICPVLVGRRGVLAVLAEALKEAAAGRGDTILISGEAGVGKSRLLAEVKDEAARLGFTVGQGNCFEPDRMVPYAALVDLLALAMRHVEVGPDEPESVGVDRELLSRLRGLAPVLADLAAIPPAEPGHEQRRLFDALAQLLSRLASPHGMLIALEDLHWGDDASLSFVEHFARRIGDQRIVFVVTYRSEELRPELRRTLAAIDRQRLARELRLDPLTYEDTREMLQAMLGSRRRIPSGFAEMMYSLTEGNPFFVEEVMKSIGGEGMRQLDSLGDSERAAALPIPRSVQDAVARRTSHLRASTRETLAVAAVAGRLFDFSLLAAVRQLDERELLGQMKELIAAQLVVEVSAEQFAFRHALTRHAVSSALLARERKLLHQIIGEAIERRFSGSLDEHRADLARHFFAAGQWEQAFENARLAGEQAQAVYAPQTAIEHFTLALEAGKRLGGTTLTGLHRARGHAYETAGDFDRARADFEEALALARAGGDQREEWRGLLALGELWAARDFARSAEYCRRALDLARASDTPVLVARSLIRLGSCQVNLEQPVVGQRHHDEALAIFEALSDERGTGETLDLLGTALLFLGDVSGAVTSYERAVALFRSLDDCYALVIPLSVLASRAGDYHLDPCVLDAGDFPRGLDAAEEALALARKIGWRSGESFACVSLALCLGPRGQYGHALTLAHEALRIAAEIPHPQRLAHAHTVLGELYLDLLALPAARSHLEQALGFARETNSRIWSNMAGAALVATCLAQGDLERAELILADLRPSGGRPGSFTERLVTLRRGELALARQRPERALELADDLNKTLEPDSGEAGRRVGPPHLGRLRAGALAALGRGSEAERLLRSEEEAALARGLLPHLWRTRTALARLYRSQGREEEAHRKLGAARAAVEELARKVPDEPVEALGGVSLRENLLRSAAAGFSSAARATAARVRAPGGLTPRELEVLNLIALGKSDREIATELSLSVRTVEHHVSSILTKTGLPRRSGVAIYALRHGLLPPDPR